MTDKKPLSETPSSAVRTALQAMDWDADYMAEVFHVDEEDILSWLDQPNQAPALLLDACQLITRCQGYSDYVEQAMMAEGLDGEAILFLLRFLVQVIEDPTGVPDDLALQLGRSMAMMQELSSFYGKDSLLEGLGESGCAEAETVEPCSDPEGFEV